MGLTYFTDIDSNSFALNIKGKRIRSQVLIFVAKSILYAKITLSQKFCFKIQFKIFYRPFIFVVPLMSKILTNA